MKDVKQTLESLCTDLTAEIESLSARIMPAVLHHGLDDIPDEVLARILVQDTSMPLLKRFPYPFHDHHSRDRKLYSKYGKRPEKLGLVNKRFRDVVSSSSECWSMVIERMPRRRIFVNAPVDLRTIRFDHDVEDIGYYQGRIRLLELQYDYIPTGFHEKERMDLSSVKSLIVHGDYRMWIEPDSFSQLCSLSCSYVPWETELQLTHCELDIPITYHVMDYCRRCINDCKCGFNYVRPYVDNGPDYKELIKFLASVPSLRSLSFPFDTESCPDYRDSETITLPNLKYLHIKCDCLCDRFLKALECPILEVMDVFLKRNLNPELQRGSGTISISSFRYPSVTHLTIRGVNNIFVRLSDIHHTFPHLRKLVVDGELTLATDGVLKYGDPTLIIDEEAELQNQGDNSSLSRLESVYLCIPMQKLPRYDSDENQDDDIQASSVTNLAHREFRCWLSSTFRWYKERGAQLRYLKTTRRRLPGEESRRDHRIAKELSTFFPLAKIIVDY